MKLKHRPNAPAGFADYTLGGVKEIDGVMQIEHVAEPWDIERIRTKLKEQVTAKRWEVETAGIDINGMKIKTGLEDQNRIANAALTASLDLSKTVDFKALSGWITLSAEQIVQIGLLVANHAQACFTAERTHHEAIDSEIDRAALEVYDINKHWPCYEA